MCIKHFKRNYFLIWFLILVLSNLFTGFSNSKILYCKEAISKENYIFPYWDNLFLKLLYKILFYVSNCFYFNKSFFRKFSNFKGWSCWIRCFKIFSINFIYSSGLRRLQTAPPPQLLKRLARAPQPRWGPPTFSGRAECGQLPPTAVPRLLRWRSMLTRYLHLLYWPAWVQLWSRFPLRRNAPTSTKSPAAISAYKSVFCLIVCTTHRYTRQP